MIEADFIEDVIGLKHEEYTWYSYDKHMLYAQSWLPESKIHGIVLIAHDIGEHSGRYKYWATRLVKEGYGVISYDSRGHGKSHGKRGYASSYYKFQKDIAAVISAVQKTFNVIPLVLYGQGFGANIVLNHVINQPQQFAGIVASSAWFEFIKGGNFLIRSVGNSFKHVIPGLMIKHGIQPEDLSHDLRFIHDYKKDPLNFGKISLRSFNQICEAGKKACRSIYKINVPLLVLHGTGDTVTSCKASRNFVRNASYKTRYIEYEDAFHHLHYDLCNDIVFSDIIAWLKQTIKNHTTETDASFTDHR